VNLRVVPPRPRGLDGHAGSGGGTIVNISSVAGRRGWANASAYCAAKFGLSGFTQALAAEGKPHGIRACVLYPGAMDTSWGIWSPQDRGGNTRPTVAPGRAAAGTRRATDRLDRGGSTRPGAQRGHCHSPDRAGLALTWRTYCAGDRTRRGSGVLRRSRELPHAAPPRRWRSRAPAALG
jgi:NAD(P)-dependent dehydrogenase (short-subunit alcohol dehydrogenase family)